MEYIIDIETIPLDPSERMATKPSHDTVKFGNTKDPVKREVMVEKAVASWESGDRAALDPMQGRVALVVIATADGSITEVLDFDDEAKILNGVFKVFQFHDLILNKVIGHNIQGFDMPFLYKRAWLNGIYPDVRLMHDCISYHPTCIKDTMKHWGFGDRNNYVSLALLCGIFGIPVKEGEITGKDFYKYWAKPEYRDACIDYCKTDVSATALLATKMGII